MNLRLVLRHLWLSVGLVLSPVAVHALTAEQVLAMSTGDSDARATAIAKAAASGDAKAPLFFQALLDGQVKVAADKVYVVRDGKARDAATDAEAELPGNADDVINSNRMRREIEGALASLKLLSPDVAQRTLAIKELKDQADESKLPLVEKAYSVETDPKLKAELGLLRAAVLVSSTDKAKRLEAARALTESRQPATKTLLLERLKPGVETDDEVRGQLQQALGALESRLAWGERLGVIFTGVSLGSILLLVALGLAITYGLMGVINMAHGELMMIGAYATYLVQNAFRAWFPGAFDAYVLVAIPASFLVAAFVGAVLERSVIRWLYGRPLETLLATWGISLVLQQAVRSIFGAQNVPVENPSWLSGGVELMSNLTLPFNRIAIIVFAGLVLLGVALVIGRTRLGLFVRGVTQNRPMAACMGVNTARVDTYAFALGSGLAGLAGCALSQVGNVGPDLGQGYIVDSFMVVVLGGVGQLAGTVYAAMGLGVLNKLLEGWQGAVLAKIMVLVFIVIFIQKRPQGIFAMKGRSAEA
ncbi:MAG: urea ABC transporter permease subunit UrtB [Caldimonas sp.]